MKTQNFRAIFLYYIATMITFIPFNFIVGSKAAWFSCAAMSIPALGYQQSLVYVILYFFTKGLFSFSCSWIFLLHRLPIFFATLALKFCDFKISVFLPLLMMFLFCIHPTGFQVFYYSWYWFIPMGIYFFCKDTIFARALSASFIAHAVGSVIWLYCASIAPSTWTALMPLVIVERLIIAAGMIGCISLYQAIETLFQEKVTV